MVDIEVVTRATMRMTIDEDVRTRKCALAVRNAAEAALGGTEQLVDRSIASDAALDRARQCPALRPR